MFLVRRDVRQVVEDRVEWNSDAGHADDLPGECRLACPWPPDEDRRHAGVVGGRETDALQGRAHVTVSHSGRLATQRPQRTRTVGRSRLCGTVGCVLSRALGWLGLAAELAGGLVTSGRQFWVMGCFDRQRREQRVDLALRDAVAAFRAADQPAVQLAASEPGADGLRVYAELPGGDRHGDERLSHAFLLFSGWLSDRTRKY